ncbi:MAG: tRNA (guanosine(46)-N7)-methyltransferase TrmB [Clostridia bacterium]|nr:tRNA (guanosine(46)-N7)-methyltransferase TrmB [Clostridia bacterium]
MRQRKAKDLEKRLAQCSDMILTYIGPETWETAFAKAGAESNARDLYLEIGCGKGQFIIKRALQAPESNFIGIEGQETVVLRAAEKARAVSGKAEWPENVPGEEVLLGVSGDLSNLVFASCFVNDMNEFFKENQLAGVYLNFSDPWPKARHEKRRLTHHLRLRDYAWAIKDGGFIEFKTDNDGLFEFSVEEFESCSDVLEVVELTRDLHAADCTYESRNVTTEYEDKFSGRGKNINYIKVIVHKK